MGPRRADVGPAEPVATRGTPARVRGSPQPGIRIPVRGPGTADELGDGAGVDVGTERTVASREQLHRRVHRRGDPSGRTSLGNATRGPEPRSRVLGVATDVDDDAPCPATACFTSSTGARGPGTSATGGPGTVDAAGGTPGGVSRRGRLPAQ